MGIVIAGLMYLGIIFAPDGFDQTEKYDLHGSETGITVGDSIDS